MLGLAPLNVTPNTYRGVTCPDPFVPWGKVYLWNIPGSSIERVTTGCILLSNTKEHWNVGHGPCQPAKENPDCWPRPTPHTTGYCNQQRHTRTSVERKGRDMGTHTREGEYKEYSWVKPSGTCLQMVKPGYSLTPALSVLGICPVRKDMSVQNPVYMNDRAALFVKTSKR